MEERRRCAWAGQDTLYLAYHDHEWGRPVADDDRVFEVLSLEGFQSGLSWLTILRKREAFRAAFADFDIAAVAAYGPDDVERLVADPGIVRHRGKIEATVGNARRALDLIAREGGLAAYVWTFDDAAVLSRALKRDEWAFVGPTTVQSFLQAIGVVNDHEEHCDTRAEVEAERAAFSVPQVIQPG